MRQLHDHRSMMRFGRIEDDVPFTEKVFRKRAIKKTASREEAQRKPVATAIVALKPGQSRHFIPKSPVTQKQVMAIITSAAYHNLGKGNYMVRSTEEGGVRVWRLN